jgi:hypothetical protein
MFFPLGFMFFLSDHGVLEKCAGPAALRKKV